MDYLPIIFSILMFDLILGGDNAVVIALACRNLPPGQQKKAIVLGTLGAIILRVILTIVIVFLLNIPFAKAVGGMLLVYIALKLIRNEDSEGKCKTAGNLTDAIKVIVFADLIMSLDNMLAVAAVSRGHWGLIILGLAVSIPIIVFFSQIILYLMNRFPIIIYAGAGILAWTAGTMIVEDNKVHLLIQQIINNRVEIFSIVLPVLITLFVMGYGWFTNTRKHAAKMPV